MSRELPPETIRPGAMPEDASMVAAVERLRARQARRARFGSIAAVVAFGVVGAVAALRLLAGI
jgi:hypothetical protein